MSAMASQITSQIWYDELFRNLVICMALSILHHSSLLIEWINLLRLARQKEQDISMRGTNLVKLEDFVEQAGRRNKK